MSSGLTDHVSSLGRHIQPARQVLVGAGCLLISIHQLLEIVI